MSTFEPEVEVEPQELSFEEQVEAQFSPAEETNETTPEEETSGEGSDGEEEQDDVEPVEAAPAPPVVEDGFIQLGDRRISAEEAKGLANVYDWIQSRPEEFVNYLQVLEGKAQVVPVGASQQAPTEVDPDEYVDPAIIALRQELAEVRQQTQGFQDFQRMQAYQQADYTARKAMGDFQSRYDLTADEMKSLEDQAAIVVNGLVARQPTISASEAATKGLEAAYWANETYREREFSRRTEQANTDRKRQRKLAGVSGTSGSVPREKPAPRTEEERREAMVAEIAQVMQEN